MRATETILVLMTALFLTAELSASERIQKRSSLGCTTAYYILRNSIPKSCNAALNHITASLANRSQVINGGEMCASYCITPLKQAAQECTAINDIYTAISLMCCWNEYGQQCLSLTGHASLTELTSECGHYLNQSSPNNCSTACSAALSSAATTLGCCLRALLTGPENIGFLEPSLWEQCNSQVDSPGPLCTQCSGATFSSSEPLTLLAIAALFVPLFIL